MDRPGTWQEEALAGAQRRPPEHTPQPFPARARHCEGVDHHSRRPEHGHAGRPAVGTTLHRASMVRSAAMSKKTKMRKLKARRNKANHRVKPNAGR